MVIEIYNRYKNIHIQIDWAVYSSSESELADAPPEKGILFTAFTWRGGFDATGVTILEEAEDTRGAGVEEKEGGAANVGLLSTEPERAGNADASLPLIEREVEIAAAEEEEVEVETGFGAAIVAGTDVLTEFCLGMFMFSFTS